MKKTPEEEFNKVMDEVEEVIRRTKSALDNFKINAKIRKLNNELNTITTDYFNYLYDYKKSCAFFKNKEHLRAASQFYNNSDLMKLKPQVDAYRAAISNR